MFVILKENNREVNTLAVTNSKSEVFLFILTDSIFQLSIIEGFEYPAEIDNTKFLFENGFLKKDTLDYSSIEIAFKKIIDFYKIELEDNKCFFKEEYNTFSNDFSCSYYFEEVLFIEAEKV